MIELANKVTPATPQPLAPQPPDNAVTGEGTPPTTTDTPPATPGTTPPRPA